MDDGFYLFDSTMPFQAGETGHSSIFTIRSDFQAAILQNITYSFFYTRPDERKGYLEETYNAFVCGQDMEEPEEYWGGVGYCTSDDCHDALSINGLECEQGCTPCQDGSLHDDRQMH